MNLLDGSNHNSNFSENDLDKLDKAPSVESLREQLEQTSVEPQGAPAYGTLGERLGDAPPPVAPAYGTLGERLGDARGPLAWAADGGRGFSNVVEPHFEPPERPRTAPLHTADGARARDQQNIALLIASMQELTAVVAKHSEELRGLREDCRASSRRAAISPSAIAATPRAQRGRRVAAPPRARRGDSAARSRGEVDGSRPRPRR